MNCKKQESAAIANIPESDTLESTTDIFKALSDLSRLKIITAKT